MQVPLIYKDRPMFGFDMGNRTVKVVQLAPHGHAKKVLGYGQVSFPASIVVEGIISDPDLLAEHVKPLLAGKAVGKITARRVAASLPMGKIFTRTIKLPVMSENDLQQAVHFEAEQYIPVPINDLYLDYQVTGRSKDAKTTQEHLDINLVATPRAIVDSYIKLFDRLGLEVDSIETSLDAVTRALKVKAAPATPALVLDFGSRSADVAVFKNALIVSSSISLGGDDLTESLVGKLGISAAEATEIKFKFGLTSGDLQTKIKAALKDQLQTVVTEAKKVMKYYQDQGKDRAQLKSLLLCGGTAGMPGLAEYLKKELGIEVTVINPWTQVDLGRLKPINKRDVAAYTTAVGLAGRGMIHD